MSSHASGIAALASTHQPARSVATATASRAFPSLLPEASNAATSASRRARRRAYSVATPLLVVRDTRSQLSCGGARGPNIDVRVRRTDLVTACPLGQIKRLVGSFHEMLIASVDARNHRRTPDGDGHSPRLPAGMRNGQVENGCADGLSHMLGSLKRCFRKQDNEFLATKPGDHISGPGNVCRQRRCDSPQALISALVTELVVVCLEVIDVDHHERQRGLAT